MLTRTQPPPSLQCSDSIVDCDTEDIGPQHAEPDPFAGRNRYVFVKLPDWLVEMEYSELLQRLARIRADVANLFKQCLDCSPYRCDE